MTIKFFNLSTICKPSIHTRDCPSNGAVYEIPQFSHRRSSFGRLFHTRTPSCANDLSQYLDVLDLGTTTGLVLLIEYLEVFSSIRFLMKEGGHIVYNFEYFTCHAF